MTESLMTQPAQTNNAAAVSTSPAASDPAPTTAPAVESGNQAAATATQEAEKAPAGAPEKYEFTAPEGRHFDNEVMSTYSEVARELNLSQESAQKMIDRLGPKIAERQIAQIEAVQTGWLDSARTDKEFGGDALQDNLVIARKALDTFGTPELRTLLNTTGLGNHPDLFRFFFRAGKAVSEDSYVGPSTGGGSRPQARDFATQASILYANNT